MKAWLIPAHTTSLSSPFQVLCLFTRVHLVGVFGFCDKLVYSRLHVYLYSLKNLIFLSCTTSSSISVQASVPLIGELYCLILSSQIIFIVIVIRDLKMSEISFFFFSQQRHPAFYDHWTIWCRDFPHLSSLYYCPHFSLHNLQVMSASTVCLRGCFHASVILLAFLQ